MRGKGSHQKLPARCGEVEFTTRLPDRPLAKFACIADTADPEAVVDLLQGWICDKPNVVITVTGSAQAMDLDHELERLFLHGLASSAKSTRAWIFDGGTDSGVMKMVGDAFKDTQGEVPLIGIVPWRMVTHREVFFDAKRARANLFGSASEAPTERVRYVKRRQNSGSSSGIEPKHTHFLMVDNGIEDWGGEIKMAAAVQKEVRTRLKVPGVLLVVQGGPGTYSTVHASITNGNPVLLVKETDGCARVLADFVAVLDRAAVDVKDRNEHMWRALVKKYAPDFRERLPKQKTEAETKKFFDNFCQIMERRPLLHVYSALEQKRNSFEMKLLTAFVSAYRRTADEDRRVSALRSRLKTLQALDGPAVPPPHVESRSQNNPHLPERASVPDDKVPWSVPWDEYAPTPYTAPVVIANDVNRKERGEGGDGWADPPDVDAHGASLRMRHTYSISGGFFKSGMDRVNDVIEFDPVSRAPLNPRGRTGLAGRGLLGKWGPNHAADPIVTRWFQDEATGVRRLQMVAIRRQDNGQWAIPGGMCEEGEEVSRTLKREFTEEAGALTDPTEKEKFDHAMEELFANGKPIYTGYVDDPRNTDHAWMETQAMHFHCTDELGAHLKLQGGDDAAKAMWLDVDPLREPLYANLYASHRDWVDRIAERMNPYPATSTDDFYPTRPQLLDPSERHWDSAAAKYTCVVMNDSACDEEELERMRKYGSFEGPIAFLPRPDAPDDRPLPHNPRGRTGVRGRGKLPAYGPNHELHVVVTRFDPGRQNQLQVAVLAHYRDHGSLDGLPFFEKEPVVQLPSGPLDVAAAEQGLAAGGDLSTRIAAAARTFAHPTFSVPERRKLEMLELEPEVVAELFAADSSTVVHTGYVDDARNTDNAWVETTVVHFHCSHELGGKLEFEPYLRALSLCRKKDGDHRSRLCWKDVCAARVMQGGGPKAEATEPLPLNLRRYERVEQLRSAELDFVERAVELLKQRLQPGLLQLVARWGRCDVLETVLSNPDLLAYCQPDSVQAAFGEALRYATLPNFDARAIDLLLNHGAKPSGLWGPGLFEAGALNQQGGVSDPFGLIANLRASKAFTELDVGASLRTDVLPSDGAPRAPSPSAGAPGSASPFGKGPGTPTNTSRATSPHRARTPPTPSGFRQLLGSSGPLVAAEALSAWPAGGPSRELLERFVPGFVAYADTQPVLQVVDLVFWAVSCGSYDLARCMWARCQCPLRTALVLQVMCEKVERERPQFKARLARFHDSFGAMATGVLECIGEASVDAPRKVLLCRSGQYAHLGARGSNAVSCMELAMMHRLKNFLSHRHFQKVVDDMWNGHSNSAGHLRIADEHVGATFLDYVLQTVRLLLQSLLPFVRVLPLVSNERFDEAAFPLTAMLRRLPGPIARVFGVYQIPAVKRSMAIMSRSAFLLLFSYIALCEPCGPLVLAHYAIAAWMFALAAEEVFQMCTNVELYRSQRRGNYLDLLVIVLLFACGALRVLTISPRADAAVDLIDFLNQRTLSSLWRDEAHAGYSPVYTAGGSDLSGTSEIFSSAGCSWSVELELLRTLTATVAVLLAVRMLEVFSLLEETGIIMITSAEMALRMLAWIPLVFLLSFGVAIGMNVLAPHYRLEHSPGPLHLPLEGFAGDFSAGGPFFAPFWAIYGYFDPGALAQGRGSALAAPAFMWLYLMFSLVLLVNLLIAIFNDAFATVQAQKKEMWKMTRVLTVHMHMQAAPLPPPLNLLYLAVYPMRTLVVLLCTRGRSSKVAPEGRRLSLQESSAMPPPLSTQPSPAASPPPSPPAAGAPASAGRGLGEVHDEASEVEEIERVARMRFLRVHPRFEETAFEETQHARLFGKLQDARDHAQRTSDALESRLGLLEISSTHKSAEIHQRLAAVLEAVERAASMGGGGVPAPARVDGMAEDAIEERARRIFMAYDRDHSGDIDTVELLPALRELGIGDTHKAEIVAILKRYDMSKEGALNLQAFTDLVRDVMAFQRAHRTSSRIFKKYDVDGSGALSRNELRFALADLDFSEEAMDSHLDKFMRNYDADDVRGVDLEVFTKLVADLQKHRDELLREQRLREQRLREQKQQQQQQQLLIRQQAPIGAEGATTASSLVPMAFERPAWLDELPNWWSHTETDFKTATARLEGAMHEQVALLQHQTGSLARVTNHLAQEVARLRPEYWQRAHYATMAAPQSILEPLDSSLGISAHRPPPSMHLGLPMVEGVFPAAAGTGQRRELHHLPSGHPMARAFDHRRLQHVFEEFDYDGDGTLDVSELRAALTALGLPTSTKQAARVLGTYDADRSGRLEYSEFRALAAELAKFQEAKPAAVDDVQRTFLHHDRDGNGRLDVRELELALRDLGLPTDTPRAAQILVKYDVDRSGSLELGEFTRLVTELREFKIGASGDDDVLRSFRTFDVNRDGSIDAAELRNALAALSLSADTAQTVAVLQRYDQDGNGSLSLSEFRSLIGELRRFQVASDAVGGGGGVPLSGQAPPATSESTVGSLDYWRSVEATFDRFDLNRDGSIDTRELREALSALGLNANAAQAGAVLDRFDMRGAGALSRADFRTLVGELRKFETSGAAPAAAVAGGSFASAPRLPHRDDAPRGNAQGFRVL